MDEVWFSFRLNEVADDPEKDSLLHDDDVESPGATLSTLEYQPRLSSEDDDNGDANGLYQKSTEWNFQARVLYNFLKQKSESPNKQTNLKDQWFQLRPNLPKAKRDLAAESERLAATVMAGYAFEASLGTKSAAEEKGNDLECLSTEKEWDDLKGLGTFPCVYAAFISGDYVYVSCNSVESFGKHPIDSWILLPLAGRHSPLSVENLTVDLQHRPNAGNTGALSCLLVVTVLAYEKSDIDVKVMTKVWNLCFVNSELPCWYWTQDGSQFIRYISLSERKEQRPREICGFSEEICMDFTKGLLAWDGDDDSNNRDEFEADRTEVYMKYDYTPEEMAYGDFSGQNIAAEGNEGILTGLRRVLRLDPRETKICAPFPLGDRIPRLDPRQFASQPSLFQVLDTQDVWFCGKSTYFVRYDRQRDVMVIQRKRVTPNTSSTPSEWWEQADIDTKNIEKDCPGEWALERNKQELSALRILHISNPDVPPGYPTTKLTVLFIWRMRFLWDELHIGELVWGPALDTQTSPTVTVKRMTPIVSRLNPNRRLTFDGKGVQVLGDFRYFSLLSSPTPALRRYAPNFRICFGISLREITTWAHDSSMPTPDTREYVLEVTKGGSNLTLTSRRRTDEVRPLIFTQTCRGGDLKAQLWDPLDPMRKVRSSIRLVFSIITVVSFAITGAKLGFLKAQENQKAFWLAALSALLPTLLFLMYRLFSGKFVPGHSIRRFSFVEAIVYYSWGLIANIIPFRLLIESIYTSRHGTVSNLTGYVGTPLEKIAGKCDFIGSNVDILVSVLVLGGALEQAPSDESYALVGVSLLTEIVSASRFLVRSGVEGYGFSLQLCLFGYFLFQLITRVLISIVLLHIGTYLFLGYVGVCIVVSHIGLPGDSKPRKLLKNSLNFLVYCDAYETNQDESEPNQFVIWVCKLLFPKSNLDVLTQMRDVRVNFLVKKGSFSEGISSHGTRLGIDLSTLASLVVLMMDSGASTLRFVIVGLTALTLLFQTWFFRKVTKKFASAFMSGEP